MAGLQDLGTIANMIRKCGPQIFACVNDPDCKAALDCLQACGPTDQVRLTSVRVQILQSISTSSSIDLAAAPTLLGKCAGMFAAFPSFQLHKVNTPMH